ncbi:hypothetical protein NDU88_008808 [Pleurodeles waltl]|uniref:Uncharacterized protein n=1 Tax=Pleurodeles waltl TaxID=8319 RepID=A0AAV7NXM8_PLEWA|nr:hypothetical protein NDU88_008808 [Pleurodeles waltl]
MRRIVRAWSAPGGPMDEGLTPAGNTDIRVSKGMKIVVGPHMRRFGVEEETDVGEKSEETTTNVRSTEEDTAESVLPGGEEENTNPRPIDS